MALAICGMHYTGMAAGKFSVMQVAAAPAPFTTPG
jgi:NO-binding membrane sensor protein with MHYT domain